MQGISKPTLLGVALALTALAVPGTQAATKKKPNLQVTKLTVPSASVAPGARITLADTTANRGKTAARSSQTGLFLSRDVRRDRSDVRLGTRRVGGLKPGKTSKGTQTVALPAAVAAGTYRVIACADSAAKVREAKETDNCRSATLTVVAPATTTPTVPVTPTPTVTATPTATATPTPTATPTGDTTPPAAPSITGSTPASGADTAKTRLTGSAEDGSTVSVFKGAGCSGSAVASGSAADFAASGIEVSVDQGATTVFSATAADAAANVSPCSQSFSFTEVAAREAEPNDNTAQADTAATAAGVVITGARQFDGRLDPVSEFDLFKIVLTGPQELLISVGNATGGACSAGADPGLRLFAADGITALAADSDSAGDLCPLIGSVLEAGTYYLRVASESLSGPYDYRLTVSTAPVAIPKTFSPVGPATDAQPELVGVATPGVNVQVFGNPQCSGVPLATGTAAEFASPGITLPVPAGTGVVVWTRPESGGVTGGCLGQADYVNAPPETEPNGTIAEAGQNPALALDTLMGGRIDPFDDLDLFKIEVAQAQELAFAVLDADGVCRADPFLTIRDAAGVALGTDDDAGPGLCPLETIALAAGTYYVEVKRAVIVGSGSPETFAYRLVASPVPIATITGSDPASPAADGTPVIKGTAPAGSTVRLYLTAGCSGEPLATGTAAQFADPGIEITLGPNRTRAIRAQATRNGIPGTCSDAFVYTNTTGQPGFDFTEVEDNGSKAAVDAGSQTALTDGSKARGAIGTAGELDLYRFTLAAPTLVRLEVFGPVPGDCPASSFNPGLRILAADGATPVIADQDSGIALCPALQRVLAAGTYYAEVTAGTVLAEYRLHMNVPVSAGEEPPAVNDTAAAAVALTGSDIEVLGFHQEPADVDYYSFTLTGPRSLRAEIVEPAATGETCESNGIDARITVYGPDGTTQIATNDDSGRGFCPLLDGTGSTPPADSTRIADLPAGTYYVRVDSITSAQPANRIYDYRLNLLLR